MRRDYGHAARTVTAWLAVLAVGLAAAALAVALTRNPDPYTLICGMRFTDARTGQSAPMYVPCSARRP